MRPSTTASRNGVGAQLRALAFRKASDKRIAPLSFLILSVLSLGPPSAVCLLHYPVAAAVVLYCKPDLGGYGD